MIRQIRTCFPLGRPRTGFTLVELLVTITIIIILASLTVVVTGKIRTSARQATAMSALRQIAIANMGYSGENAGAINVIRDSGEWGSFEGPGVKFASNSFMGRMQPYLFGELEAANERALSTEIKSSLAALFQTTDLKFMESTLFSGVPVTTDGSGIPNPIAINSKLRPVWGPKNPFLRVSSFGNPAATLYMTYGRYYYSMVETRKYRPLPVSSDRSRTIYFLPDQRGMFTFLDGHIEMLSMPIPERLLDSAEP
jgi:prepilin-type N-terminal cleavage/methylation domain-containing protein